MNKTLLLFLSLLLVGLTSFYCQQDPEYTIDESRLIAHIIDPQEQNLRFYWKNEEGKNYKNARKLKSALAEKGEKLVFAVNGGMYLKDRSPQGLYLEDGQVLKNVNKVKEAYGNFYLQPNGIFYLSKDKKGTVCQTTDFKLTNNIQYATQSGPMLVIDGVLHPVFTKGSSHLHIRNGVGVLPDGKLLFAMSKKKINLYDFATYFKQKGCKNALYLDGFVSRTYLPSKDWIQEDGNFGVIIGESKLINGN